jgi:hypothetical protein
MYKGSYGIWQFNQVKKFEKIPTYIPLGNAVINIKDNINYFECPWFVYSYDGFDHSMWQYDIYEERAGFVKVNITNFIKRNEIENLILKTRLHCIRQEILKFF